MKKTLLLLMLFAVLLSACDDDDDSYNVNPYFKYFTFLQFERDVISQNGDNIRFYVSGFKYDAEMWEMSAYNKTTKETYPLKFIEQVFIDTDNPVSSVVLNIQALDIGDYNLVIKHRQTGKEFRENFIVRDLYYNFTTMLLWPHEHRVLYGLSSNWEGRSDLLFKGDEIRFRPTSHVLFEDFEALAFQNKSTGKTYISKRYTNKNGESKINIPINMPDGYYYIYSGDESFRIYSEKAYLICAKPAFKINNVRNTKGKVIINGLSFLVKEPSRLLLPSPYRVSGRSDLQFTDKKGEIVRIIQFATNFHWYGVEVNDKGTVITYTIPTESSDYEEFYMNCPLTNKAENYFDGYVSIVNGYGESNRVPLRINYK